MRALGIELFWFTVINARASVFGAFLLGVIMLTAYVDVPGISRYDVIFLSAAMYQMGVLVLGIEHIREFFVIFLFHITATLMELFKTHPSIGSWAYPDVDAAVFALATVPLFTGFLYSAVGSYISRAITLMHLRFVAFPHYRHVWILSGLIYINFFTHHFVVDARYLIFAYVVWVFYKTHIHFTVYKKVHSMPFMLAAFLTAFFIWIAENIGTYTHAWIYPSQHAGWHIVSLEKIGSWFLLLILSFALVSIVYRNRIDERAV